MTEALYTRLRSAHSCTQTPEQKIGASTAVRLHLQTIREEKYIVPIACRPPAHSGLPRLCPKGGGKSCRGEVENHGSQSGGAGQIAGSTDFV